MTPFPSPRAAWTAFVAVAVMLGAGGCSVRDAQTAAAGRTDLIGLSRMQLAMCAGLPTRTARMDPHTELLSYEHKASESNAISVSVPVIGGGLSVGSGGSCAATFKMVDDKVAAVGFSGDTDVGVGGTDAVCAPIVRHCVEALGNQSKIQTTAAGGPR